MPSENDNTGLNGGGNRGSLTAAIHVAVAARMAPGEENYIVLVETYCRTMRYDHGWVFRQ
jgi:hypothetical protein